MYRVVLEVFVPEFRVESRMLNTDFTEETAAFLIAQRSLDADFLEDSTCISVEK